MAIVVVVKFCSRRSPSLDSFMAVCWGRYRHLNRDVNFQQFFFQQQRFDADMIWS